MEIAGKQIDNSEILIKAHIILVNDDIDSEKQQELSITIYKFQHAEIILKLLSTETSINKVERELTVEEKYSGEVPSSIFEPLRNLSNKYLEHIELIQQNMVTSDHWHIILYNSAGKERLNQTGLIDTSDIVQVELSNLVNKLIEEFKNDFNVEQTEPNKQVEQGKNKEGNFKNPLEPFFSDEEHPKERAIINQHGEIIRVKF